MLELAHIVGVSKTAYVGRTTPPCETAHFEKTARVRSTSLAGTRFLDIQGATMMKIANAQLWVHDQDEALAFYTQKLGMEVRADVTLPELGDFRWLAVGPADQPDFAIVLMAIPGPPVMDPATAEQVRELMAKGFSGTVFLTTDDCQASYEELKARGVEFTEQPEERPYGIDSGFRDPSGNSLRLTEVRLPASV
jgi:catechol 2,3-dioxygenase-like lactoylglutathione lyase family enzyme